MQSSKDLLTTYNFLDPDEKKKYTHHEFQSFAYKLASDLNDLQHLNIYMMLAKNVERSIMERAFSYASDAQDNKGKKFMWKLKELRNELFERMNADNFDYEFVQKEMKPFREKLAKSLFIKKNKFNDILFSKEILPKKNKVLLLNCLNKEFVEKLIRLGYKISALESRALKNVAQEYFESYGRKLQPKITSTQFLKNKFKNESFDFLIFNESWFCIPLEVELSCLKEAFRILKPEGKLQILIKSGEEKQEWKKYIFKEESLKYVLKINSRDTLEEQIENVGFKILEKEYSDEGVLYLLSK